MNVEFEIDNDTTSLTPIAKLLMGKSLDIATTNITFKQFEVLIDPFVLQQFNITFEDVVNSLMNHKKVEPDDIEKISNSWHDSRKWGKVFGVERHSEIPEYEYFYEHPEILNYYKLKFELIKCFYDNLLSVWGKAIWTSPLCISDDVNADIYFLIKKTSPETIKHCVYSALGKKDAKRLIDTFIDMYREDTKFSNHIKLTNPDLAEILREIL